MLGRIERFFSRRKQELDSDDITRGLNILARKIGQLSPYRHLCKDPMVIVASEGVTSVLSLQNRTRTKKVNLFHTDCAIIQEISTAADDLEHDCLKTFPLGWLNLNMLTSITDITGSDDLFRNSIQQGIVLFKSPTLVVYDLDRKFQLVYKMMMAWHVYRMANADFVGSRYAPIDFREKNLLDSLYILYYLVQQRQGLPLQFSEIKTWYYAGPTLQAYVADFINQAYCHLIKREDPNYLPISIDIITYSEGWRLVPSL